MPSTRNAIFALAAVAVIVGGLVYFLAPSRPETPGPVSIPDGAGQAPSSQPAGERSPAAAIKPRTVPESEPAEGAASSRGALEIEVIGPKGRAAPNARLVLTRGKDVFGAATTDDHGVASLRAGEGDAGILIVPERAPRYETTISIEPGRHRIELPAGVSISGRVEVDGTPPKEAVRLWADSQEIPWGERSAAVWAALNGDSNSALTTTASGAFEIDGLKPGSDWKFGPRSVGYRLEEARGRRPDGLRGHRARDRCRHEALAPARRSRTRRLGAGPCPGAEGAPDDLSPGGHVRHDAKRMAQG